MPILVSNHPAKTLPKFPVGTTKVVFSRSGTQTQPSEKIINGLSEDTSQVDRIDRGEADCFPKGQIGEQFLDRGLGIVEGSLDSQRKYVAGPCRSFDVPAMGRLYHWGKE